VLRIRIRIRTDPHSFWSGGPKLPTKVKKIQVFLSARCSLLRDEDFCWSLDVFYGCLGVSKLQFLIKKNVFFSCKFFPMFGYQNPGPGSGSGFVFGSVLTQNALSGSALKPIRICSTEEKTEANFFLSKPTVKY
jgi:hypothetical protein